MAKGDNCWSSELLGVLNQVTSAINNSPSNLYINPSVLKEILALDKELSSVLNDLSLTHNARSRQILQRLASCSNRKLADVAPKCGKSLRFCSSDTSSRCVTQQRSSKSSAADNPSSSSISLYSTDSIISQRSEEDHDEKKNLIIRCNYNSQHQPVNKNLVQIFRQESSCQMPPLCPDSCCQDNSAFRCRSRRDMEIRRRPGSRDYSKSRRKEERKERKSEERKRQKIKQQKEKDHLRNEKKEKGKRRKDKEKQMKERERERKDKERERRALERERRQRKREEEREIRKREWEEEKEMRRREREEEREIRGLEREEKRDRKEQERDEENERKEKEREEAKIRKEKEKEEEKKRKEAEREDEKKKKEKEREEAKEKYWRICNGCDYEELNEPPEAKSTTQTDSGESVDCRESSDQEESQGALNTCKTGVQCNIPCMCPRCVLSCKSTQATNTKITTPPDYQDLPSQSSTPCDQSRLTRFLSSFANGGLQLRLLPPEKTCRNTKSCTLPKVRLPQSATIDTSCSPPKIKCSRAVEPYQIKQSECSRPAQQVNLRHQHQLKPRQPPPIKSTPCVRRLRDQTIRCQRPCKLPRCTRAPSFPRLTPCVTPPCRFKSPCRNNPCHSTLRVPRTYLSTPSCIKKPCNSCQNTPPPCLSRPSVCFEPQLHDKVPNTMLEPPVTAPCPSNLRLSAPNASAPSVPRPCNRLIPCTPPPNPSRPSTPKRISLPGNFRPCKQTRCPSQSSISPSGSVPCMRDTRSSKTCPPSPCSPHISGSSSPGCSRPRTPPRSFPCNSQRNFHQTSNLCNPQPRDATPCISHATDNPPLPKPCLWKPGVYESCGSPATCSRSFKQQPVTCDSQCKLGKWTCCTKSARHPGQSSPRKSCSRVSICQPDAPNRKNFPTKITPVYDPDLHPKVCPLRPYGSSTVPCSWKRCKRTEKLCSSSCSNSDICRLKNSCESRRYSLSPVCSKEDICYLRRKNDRPWWSPRSPSSFSFGGWSDRRQRCDLRKYWSPYCLNDERCYPRGYPHHPWWNCYPLNGPYCSMESVCYQPGYRFPYFPRECVSIPCTAAPFGPRLCAPPRESFSYSPPTQRGPPHRHRCASPRRPPPPYMPCPPLYPPCLAPYPPPLYPPPCFRTSPSCSPTPCSSRMSVSSSRPQPDGRIWDTPTSGPTICNETLRRPRLFKGPSCLKKFPKCAGNHGMKRFHFPKCCDVKPCSIPACSPKTGKHTPPRPLSPCGSPTPSFGNVRYPTPSRSSYGSNYSPHPSPSLSYQPCEYWPNQFQTYGGYPSCYPSHISSGPNGVSLHPKLCLSKLKCNKLYHMSCKSGLPKYNDSGSSSVYSESSCSSSVSSLSSSESTYTSRSSSLSSSSSRTSPSYCVASCRNSSSNLFKRRLSNSSICSTSDCSPRCTFCDVIDGFRLNRQQCGSLYPSKSPPPGKPNQQGPICAPPMTCRKPVHCARSQVCSSATGLQYSSRLKSKGVDHYDERIRFELQKIGMDQLIQASKPAKCCKQTVLNQPSREELPYAASLASLPLDRADIRVIRQSVRMASKKIDGKYTSLENRTKLAYYANLLLDDFETGKPKSPPEYEVRYFYFTLDDEENVQYSLRKSYTKTSMFKFFQIFNWSDKMSPQANKLDSSSQKVDFSTSLDWKKHITSTEIEDELLVVSSIEKTTDTLENLVFSDILLANHSGVDDSKVENSLDENYINEFKFKRDRKKNHELKMNFTLTETSLETDSLFENNCNPKSFVTGFLDSTHTATKKINASSQTEMNESSFENPRKSNFVVAASQTDNETIGVNLDSSTFSEEIMRLFSSSDTNSVEYLKKNTKCLVFTSEATSESDSVEVQLKSEVFSPIKDLSGQNYHSNDKEFRNDTETLEEAIKEVLGEINKLATIAESFKGKTPISDVSNCRDIITKSTVYSTCSSKLPSEHYRASVTKDFGNKRPECNEIVHKTCLHFDPSRKQISKGQFIVKMYNSINEVITQIYGEAEKLATLRKNRFAISGVRNEAFADIHCKRNIVRSGAGKTAKGTGNNLPKICAKKEKRNYPHNSLENLERRVYTSAGKIITTFYNSRGKALKTIYSLEGERIAEGSSIVKVLFSDTGSFISGYCDSKGNILKAVYDSQSKLLRKTFNSEMMLLTFPLEDRKQKTKHIFNSQGFPIYQLYSEDGKLLTSIYDFEGNLIRGTFLGNISQLSPRMFDKHGKFILGRYDRNGKIYKRILDSHGNNLQQLYKADKTTLKKAPIRLKILDQNGEPVRKFFKKNKTPLTHVYDILGNLLCQASEGNSKDLLYRLFDFEGFFILGRLDELRHLIEAVYDEKGNKILQVRVLDTEAGDMIKISKLYSSKGKYLVNFYDEGGEYLKNVYDAKGFLIESSPSGRVVKLAGRMFDMAGYFIHGRYDAKKNPIREIFDHEGFKILRVYDVNGQPVRRLPQSNRIFNCKGRPVRHIYKSGHKIISGVYDVIGDMIGGVLSTDAEELAPFLFDMEGKFINSRYDSRMKLIKHVYDSRNNLLSRVYTQGSLKCSKSRPLKTVYVKVECKEMSSIKAACNNAHTTFDGHCQTLPKAILPPLTMPKVNKKSSKFVVLSSRKRKRGDQYFEEGRELVSVKCQCKFRGKKDIDKPSSGSPAAKCTNQKRNDSISSSPHPAKRKKMERNVKRGSLKQENSGKGKPETSHQNDYQKTTASLQNSESRQTKLPTTILPCYETTRSDTQRNADSLECLLDGYLQHEKTTHRTRETECKNIEVTSHSNTEIQTATVTSNRPNYSNETTEESSTAATVSDSTQNTSSSNILDNDTEDAFLCNIPNAPPFILKMNKASPIQVEPEQMEKSELCCSPQSFNSTDESYDMEDLSYYSSSSVLEKKNEFYTEIPDLNMFIDGNCPCLEDEAFSKFVAKSITWIKAQGQKTFERRCGMFMSTPTICMAGLTSISNNPFGVDEIDSRRPGKNNRSFSIADALYKNNSYHNHSKIPRMLHPGKCKVHSKMKNVQLSPGSKGCAANKANTCSGPCPADKMELQINPYVKVSVSTTCPSLTNASPSGNVKGGAKEGNKNKNANIQASKPSMGDCMKGIKSDPGCYCGNDIVEPTPCPIRLREDCECVEEEAAAQTAEPEEEEPLCYCPPGEQPLLMKKSNIECDCANRRRCEDETLVEPPKQKPDVFWALTKVSLLKDGTKNFEIIDVSPVPPGYYLMPDVNNLVLVGPQPKPVKATPSKNCTCK